MIAQPNSAEVLPLTSDVIFQTRVRSHSAWKGQYPGGRNGFSEPCCAEGMVISDIAAQVVQLSDHGIKVIGHVGFGSVIVLAKNFRSPGLNIHFFGHERATIILGNCSALHGQISIEGPQQTFVFSDSHHNFRINATMRGHSGALFVGRGGSSNAVDFLVEGPGVSLSVGDDALISYGVTVSTSDSHGIISINGGKAALNPPSSIRIGSHVWLGAHVTIHKGRIVGQGAIVGGRSIVTRNVPAFALVAGAPAEIKQTGVTWTRASQPSQTEIEAACDQVRIADGPW